MKDIWLVEIKFSGVWSAIYAQTTKELAEEARENIIKKNLYEDVRIREIILYDI